jgi:hypothetical protein
LKQPQQLNHKRQDNLKNGWIYNRQTLTEMYQLLKYFPIDSINYLNTELVFSCVSYVLVLTERQLLLFRHTSRFFYHTSSGQQKGRWWPAHGYLRLYGPLLL